ncbi:MAG: ABC transporter permease [Chitinophagaceae bacterium]|nr:ABC transporter permease [Chitinophagaceae bacterium]
MNKTWLIIQREYLTRVRNKTFLLSTFLTPLVFVIIIAAVILITVKSVNEEKIAVGDKDGVLKEYLKSSKSTSFDFIANADTALLSKDYAAVLLAPGNGVNKGDQFEIYSRKNLGVMTEESIRRQVNDAVQTRLVTQMGNISKEAYDSIKKAARATDLNTKVVGEGSEVTSGNSGVAYGVGYATSFLIYITLFLYGSMVMRGVMEEKTNRIAEVVVSSVKPTQLMLGKIIGIGAVGVTQFLLWIILIMLMSTAVGAIVPPEVMEQVNAANRGMPGAAMTTQTNDAVMMLAKTSSTLGTVNWPLIIGCFLFYFTFGYLFYAALFAAVGSAVNEDPQDAQSLMFPITLPIILAIVIMINAITQPESSLATWSSMIPFFSPIVMMARIPFGVPGTVPWWQLGVSMALLVAGFFFTTWLSAKIYRTGILMYGKKVTLKEMWKWAFKKV